MTKVMQARLRVNVFPLIERGDVTESSVNKSRPFHAFPPIVATVFAGSKSHDGCFSNKSRTWDKTERRFS